MNTMDRIPDTPLYIGNLTDAETIRKTSPHVDAVLNVSKRRPGTHTIHIPLNDGENTQEQFNAAVDSLIRLMQTNETVFVHCAAGISRATTTSATALAHYNKIGLKEAFEIVKDGREQTSPAPKLIEHAIKYLQINGHTIEHTPEQIRPDEGGFWNFSKKYGKSGRR